MISQTRPHRPASRASLLLLIGLAIATGGCAGKYRDDSTLPRPAAATGADSFVEEVRQLSAREGLVVARDYLVGAVAERDDSRGEMEKRLIRASRDADYTFPDSVVALSDQRRAGIGIAYIPGMKAKGGAEESKPVQALKEAASESAELGFSSVMIPAVSRGRVEKNAAAMSESLKEVFVESEEVILLAKSKGSHDIVYYLLHQGSELSPEERAKLKAVVILGGTVQGSFVADWMANHTSPWAAGTRAMLTLSGRGSQVAMLKNVAKSPWTEIPEGFPLSLYPNLTFITLVVLPDGDDGRSSGGDWSPFMIEEIQKTAGWESPNDSLVETAAGLVPNFIEAPQWIVRTSGSHAFPKGEYLDGSKVTPNTIPLEDGTLNPECGGEIMNAFLRALPRSVLE